MHRLSVIIPTLNEAAWLPTLLDALWAQSRPPDEIIVADGGSTDGTDTLARAAGALVVPGGRPAAGRNAGARVAMGDILLFLDADVIPRPDFLARALEEFTLSAHAATTCLLEPLNDDAVDRVLVEALNLYIKNVQRVSARAPGFCIFVRRTVHEAIGGFDESLLLAEDHDYAQRVARLARFGVLTNVRIPVSLRRLDEEGLLQLGYKYLWAEAQIFASRPIYSAPFEYPFGVHRPLGTSPRRRHAILASWRTPLDHWGRSVRYLSATRVSHLRRLTHVEWVEAARRRVPLRLIPSGLPTTYLDLRRRLALLQTAGWPVREILTRWPAERLRRLSRFHSVSGPRAARLSEKESGDSSPPL